MAHGDMVKHQRAAVGDLHASAAGQASGAASAAGAAARYGDLLDGYIVDHADADGVEGLTYAWTPRQLVEVLGEDDGRRAARLLEVTEAGTFEDGSSTLQMRTEPDDAQWWEGVRARLQAARDLRPQPSRDDKLVTSWNGLAIAALSEAGVLLKVSSYLDAARRCAQFLVSSHLVDDRLRRASPPGNSSGSPLQAACWRRR